MNLVIQMINQLDQEQPYNVIKSTYSLYSFQTLALVWIQFQQLQIRSQRVRTRILRQWNIKIHWRGSSSWILYQIDGNGLPPSGLALKLSRLSLPLQKEISQSVLWEPCQVCETLSTLSSKINSWFWCNLQDIQNTRRKRSFYAPNTARGQGILF